MGEGRVRVNPKVYPLTLTLSHDGERELLKI
jgi:hypothetical protein